MNEIQAYQKCEQALALKKNIETSYLHLAKLLSEIRSQRLYSPQYDTFPSFLMELDMSEATASRMISIYDKLITEYGIPEHEIEKVNGWTKALIVAKRSRNKEEAEQLLELAQVQSKAHLEATIRERQDGIDQANCQHDWVRFQVCRHCNLKERI